MAEEKAGNGAVLAQLSVLGDDGALSLRATRCRRDGVIAFPPERFGCQACGAFGDDLEEHLIPARGTVVASAEVHRHRGPGPAAPFTIASISLDAGPHANALLGRSAEHGASVNGRIEQFGDDSFVVFDVEEEA